MSEERINKIKSLLEFDFVPKWDDESKVNKIKHKPRKKEYKNRETKTKKTTTRKYSIKTNLQKNIGEALKQLLKRDGISREIENIIKEIIKKNAFSVNIKFIKDDNYFYKPIQEDKYYTEKEQLVNDSIIYDGKLIKIEKEEINISTKFDYVLICKKSKEIFPPPSFSSFEKIIDGYIFDAKISAHKREFINSLIKSNSEEDINALNDRTFHEYIFKLNNKKFRCLDAVKNEIFTNKDNRFYVQKNSITLTCKEILSDKKYDNIKHEMETLHHKTIEFQIKAIIESIAKKAKYNIFKKNNRKYVCAYKCTNISNNTHTVICDQILNFIKENKKTNVKSLLDRTSNIGLSKVDILKELRWLVKSGFIRHYETGDLEIISSENI